MCVSPTNQGLLYTTCNHQLFCHLFSRSSVHKQDIKANTVYQSKQIQFCPSPHVLFISSHQVSTYLKIEISFNQKRWKAVARTGQQRRYCVYGASEACGETACSPKTPAEDQSEQWLSRLQLRAGETSAALPAIWTWCMVWWIFSGRRNRAESSGGHSAAMMDRRKGGKMGPLVFIEIGCILYINMCPAHEIYSCHCLH